MRVVSAEQMRSVEDRAIREYGIPSLLLMENAAIAVVQEVRRLLEGLNKSIRGEKVVIFVGKGNNGGDGLAIARHLFILGIDVTVFSFAKQQEFKGDAAVNLRLFQGTESKLFFIEGEKQLRLARLALTQARIVIDAIYGTGFRGALPSIIEEYVVEINRSEAVIISVDIASGIEADTGKVYRTAIRANTTVTFGLPKLGHFLADGPEYSGQVLVDPISIPEKYLQDEAIATHVLTDSLIKDLIPIRKLQNHKGTHGKGILIAGSEGMSGAAVLAGKAAIRCGIGLLQIIAPSNISGTIDSQLTEATIWIGNKGPCLNGDALQIIQDRCSNANAIAVGPGLSQNEIFQQVMIDLLDSIVIPIVLDADALNLLAGLIRNSVWHHSRGNVILTPHPAEMARLCGCTTEEVQKNRLELSVSKAIEWGVTVVLKGAVTIVAAPDGRAFLNPTGNPGLGTGGTGDVLTGSILAWLAQGLDPVDAACLAVFMHGKAADDLAREFGWSGFTATEVADTLPKVRRTLEMATGRG